MTLQWARGDAYERYIGRWSRLVAPAFLSWLNVSPGREWLDVGCGTGALSVAILDHCEPRSVVAVEPSPGFRKYAREILAGRAKLLEGSATAIPLGHAAVDVVVSGLVLNFVADQRGALTAMARVTRDGGTVAAYVWDYAGEMQLLRYFWDGAAELDPAAARLDEGCRFRLCSPAALEDLFVHAGLREVDVIAIDIATPFASFTDYWEPFLGGQGPAPKYVASLARAARARLRENVRARLPIAADGAIALTARAWAVRGRRGRHSGRH